MDRVYISTERVDDTNVTGLILALRQSGFQVSHSPRNPIDGEDERWRDWYARGCQKALDQADIFIIAITAGWDASTWMAHESEEALKQRTTGQIRRIFYHNPAKLPIHSDVMQRLYLNEKLPDDLDTMLDVLANV